MARMLTIYNCGTQFNRDQGTAAQPGQAGELIADLYDRTQAQDLNDYGRLDLASYDYKLIHDGPGSRPQGFVRRERDAQGKVRYVKHDASASKARTPGLGSRGDEANPEWVRKMAQIASGLAFGSGWEENVKSAVHAIAALKHRPDVVNLAGWSRGAVTCHMMAHAFAGQWPAMPVNIFAVDPVPGGSRLSHGPEQLDIPANVAHYWGVLAKDDRKLGFGLAVVRGVDDGRQRRRFFLMPGIHDTLVQGAAGLLGIAVLVDHLAGRFLSSQGTRLARQIRLSNLQICENYAIAKQNESAYRALAGEGLLNKLLGLGGKAPARDHLPGGLRGVPARELREACFVNDHHETAFREAFPEVYRVAFDKIPNNEPVPASERMRLKERLDAMRGQSRNSFAVLKNTGLAGYVDPS